MSVYVVGVDSSATAHRAAEIAADLARSTGAALHLVTAYEQKAPVRIPNSDEIGSLDRAESLLATLASDLRPTVAEITTAAIDAKPSDAVCDEAERLGATLIVVGSKRTQGVARVLGSHATKILASSPCDVYVAHTT